MIDNFLVRLNDFFIFGKGEPLIFTSISFWIFFTVVYGVFTVIYKQYNVKNLFLFLVSIFFYYKASGLFFLLLLLTVVYDYFISHAIAGHVTPNPGLDNVKG